MFTFDIVEVNFCKVLFIFLHHVTLHQFRNVINLFSILMDTNIRLKEKDLQQMNGDVVKEHAQVHYHSVQIIPSLFDFLQLIHVHRFMQVNKSLIKLYRVREKRQLLFQRYIQKNLFVHALQILVW